MRREISETCPRSAVASRPTAESGEIYLLLPSGVAGVDPYTRLLVTAGCDYGRATGLQDSANRFCPAYSDGGRTPLAGEKRVKLEELSAVFCASCQYGDDVCDTLFCEPSLLMVEVAMATLRLFCDTIRLTDPGCHTQYCGSISGRGDLVENHDEQPDVVCVASPAVWNISGMDQWCSETCNHGYDNQCTETLCTCTNREADRLTECSQFGPTPQYHSVPGMSTWCQRSCTAGHCPSSHCRCADDQWSDDQALTDEQQTSTTSTTQYTSDGTSLGTQSTTSQGTQSTTSDYTSDETQSTTSDGTQSTTSDYTSDETQSTTSDGTQSTTSDYTSDGTQSTTSDGTSVGTKYISPEDQETGENGLGVVSSLVCGHTLIYQQQELADRHCIREKRAELEEKSFDPHILDQIESFAPQLLCALISSSDPATTCSHMFCGYNPLAVDVIRSAMCSVCQQFSQQISSHCQTAYC